ncbi:MAG: tRNA glutamyl-Q(34) synthetase GluQRS [Thermoleophilaceae bacterium]
MDLGAALERRLHRASSSGSIDGRFAPSPTGPLHLGNLRTALVAWLFARSAGSAFALRIDDLDPQRSRAEHERGQLADLEAIGIDWDGVPVRQSERTELYLDALTRLQAQGRVYECYCSRAEIRTAAEAPHGTLPEGAYPGTCRDLTAAERAERARQTGRPPALRLDARGEHVAVEDRLHGSIDSAVDDIVLRRGDGTPAYNLAVVVDDADQAIDEVVRADDLLDTTPRQVLLARLLELPVPAYAHVPLVLGSDGARLAKRHGAVTLADAAAHGRTVDDVVAWMAESLGLAEEGERPTAGQLVGRFDPGRMTREPVTLPPS